MNIIPAITVMRKRQIMNMKYGKKMSLMQKLFFAVFANMK